MTAGRLRARCRYGGLDRRVATRPVSVSEGARIGRDVDRVLLEYGQGNDVERPFMCRGKHDESSGSVLMRPQPVSGGDAPTITGYETGKGELR